MLAEQLDVRYIQFVGEGERPTPVIDAEGLRMLQRFMVLRLLARAEVSLARALKRLAPLMRDRPLCRSAVLLASPTSDEVTN